MRPRVGAVTVWGGLDVVFREEAHLRRLPEAVVVFRSPAFAPPPLWTLWHTRKIHFSIVAFLLSHFEKPAGLEATVKTTKSKTSPARSWSC